jgi:IclR family transcriptional regulator, acetate operon repressor
MSTVQSVERAFLILRALSLGPAGVSEIAETVGLPKSTVSRLLGTMESLGAVDRQDGATDYQLGEGLAELTASADSNGLLVASVRPVLDGLSARVGEATTLSVPEGYSMLFLVQVESPQPVQVRDYTGVSTPMHVVPAGLCVMAHWPLEDVQRYLARPLEAYTTHTLVDPASILARLDQVRARGWAFVEEEFAEGISSVAAPVFHPDGHVAGAITAHGPTYRFPGSQALDQIAADVSHTAGRFAVRIRKPVGARSAG